MITQDLYYRMHYLHRNLKLSSGEITAELGNVSESTVRRWLAKPKFEERSKREVPSKLDPYKERIDEMLAERDYPATRIHQDLRERGYDGGYSTVRRRVAEVRRRRRKTYFKLHFDPGEAAQVDFGCCGTIPRGNVNRRLSVFVMVLCHSRLAHAEFILQEREEHFLTCHQNAFKRFGGVPKRVVVDNCKCAVVKNPRYESPVYNSRYLDFATFHGFEPVACNPRSPNEKGIVENAVGYLKKNFMPGRRFNSLAEANATLENWLETVANVRVHAATGERPVDAFESRERDELGPLPPNEFDCATVKSCRADKRCRVWFDSNGYSVPESRVDDVDLLKATPDHVAIYANGTLVARHRRSYERKRDVVDPDHQRGMRLARRRAAEQNLLRDFTALAPVAGPFLEELEAKELNPRHHVRRIMALVERHGRERVARALEDALEFKAVRVEYVENLLERRPGTNGFEGVLHVPRAGDLLNVKLKQPNLEIYKRR